MTAEEAVAGLVLCACELLRAARGEEGNSPPPWAKADDAYASEDADSEAFSVERFLEIAGGVKRNGDVMEPPVDDRPALEDTHFEAEDTVAEIESLSTEPVGEEKVLREAISSDSFPDAGATTEQRRTPDSFDEAEQIVRRFSPHAFLEPEPFGSASVSSAVSKRSKAGGFDAERFSEYMERDGRRYDSGYEHY